MENIKVVIAIDGYSSCGKSTFAKLIARKIKYIYVDSGAMYRAVALFCLQNNIYENKILNKQLLIERLNEIYIKFEYNPENGKSQTILNDVNVESDIRKERVTLLVSKISAIKEVRIKLVELQQNIGKSKGIVMDGRDIGTVVFPDAEFKIFMTANTLIRAQRRYDELIQKGEEVNFDEVEHHIIERDHLDETRKESPLKKADDAIILDNSDMTIEDQMVWFMKIFDQKFNG